MTEEALYYEFSARLRLERNQRKKEQKTLLKAFYDKGASVFQSKFDGFKVFHVCFVKVSRFVMIALLGVCVFLPRRSDVLRKLLWLTRGKMNMETRGDTDVGGP